MTHILKNHNLSQLYSNIDVTTISSAIRTRDRHMILKVGLNFGENGKMLRYKHVPLSATNLTQMTTPLNEHKASILELIGILEDAKEWAERRCKFTADHGEPRLVSLFSKVLLEESPIMVHGVHKERMITLEFFGEGLRGMSVKLDTRKAERKRVFALRMNEIIDTFKNHLKDVNELNFEKLMEGITA